MATKKASVLRPSILEGLVAPAKLPISRSVDKLRLLNDNIVLTFDQGGTFLPDDSHVLARLTFAGAPASPDPAGVCTGEQVIMVRTDGSVFPNGDAWKCLTCGVSKENNHAIPIEYPDYGYPQAFADGKRVMAGFYIIDCGDFDLASAVRLNVLRYIRFDSATLQTALHLVPPFESFDCTPLSTYWLQFVHFQR